MKRFRIKNEELKETLGFTLIELMVAIAIVAILATIGIIAFGATQASARDAKRKGDLEDIKKGLYLYRSAGGSFCLGGKGACAAATQYILYKDATSTTPDIIETTLVPNLKGYPQYRYLITVTGDDAFKISADMETTQAANGCTPDTGGAGNSNNDYCISE